MQGGGALRAGLSVLCLSAVLWAAPGGAPVAAQDRAATLADVKQDVSVLFYELQRLRRELSTTGGPSVAVQGGPLDRVAEIETALSRMTGKIEELEFRIDQVVTDGTNRLGDLDFRICELEPDCDIASLGDTPRIGGAPEAETVQPDSAPVVGTDMMPGDSGALAIGEEDDFLAAQSALDVGDFDGAVALFGTFRETYPGSPLEPGAILGEGEALEGLGDTREAARRYLRVFSDYPEAEPAPEALYRLGSALGQLGSTNEACLTLSEVGARYPASDFVTAAAQTRTDLACQ